MFTAITFPIMSYLHISVPSIVQYLTEKSKFFVIAKQTFAAIRISIKFSATKKLSSFYPEEFFFRLYT